ncbi:hypothetical protein JCGZ_14320 [Jatropha curcas]|uniref:Membrane-associated kinase regulator 6 n=1 Tax=Jatropha curcas TaxID=180498 RepID=A0A067K9Q3_JATCU|nr:probable membrane-associated kinase regulator 6 [Jatropha curcas]XP_037495077.1 probable membrane-associated kinase regulator 6 [Jatropha curcas]XP_037495078.1 probable membrane-associated kinase regulator 6 [Jatropha curcas]KDP28549.1 hypothetical protein JCGZ_14320 [Jatropha curcas]
MDSSQPLAIESFSYTWLTSINSRLDGLEELRASLDSYHEATSEELDYKILKSKRSLEEVQNFDFDVPISQYSDALVHADQLFSDGLIKPVFINQSKKEVSGSLDLDPTSSLFSRTVVPTVHVQCHIFKRWRKSSERILLKCFGYLRPLCYKITGSRNSTSVDDIDRRVDRRVRQVKSWSNSPQESPGISNSRTDWCDIESSIYEAVLHCKRSIDK